MQRSSSVLTAGWPVLPLPDPRLKVQACCNGRHGDTLLLMLFPDACIYKLLRDHSVLHVLLSCGHVQWSHDGGGQYVQEHVDSCVML